MNIFQKITKIAYIAIVSFIVSSMYAATVKASDINMYDSGDNINIQMTPEYPAQNSKVKVNLSSFSFDIDRAKTTVTIDGKTIAEGYSIKQFEFTTPNNGKTTTIQISSQAPDGLIYKVERTILPASVDLMYEAYDSFRPPLYKGKADILNDARVKIVAMPEFYETNGKKIASSDLIYKWKVNHQADVLNSGYGKNTYKIERIKAGPIKTNISVSVTSRDGTIGAQKSITILPQQARTYFYFQTSAEDHSLTTLIQGGVIETERDNIFIRSVSYFMEDLKNRELVRNSWFLNGQELKAQEGVDIISFQNTAGFLRVNLLKVVENSFRPLQAASDRATVEFEKIQRDVYNQIQESQQNSLNPIENFFTS